MKQIKSKLKNSVFIKVALGMLLAVVLTTSVFAATGLINQPSTQISTEDLQDHIKDKIIEQLELKINELLMADNNSELNKMIADKINQQEVIDALKSKVETELSDLSDINYSQVDKVISDTIDSLLDTTINETVKVAIDNALSNVDIDNTFTVDEALRSAINTEVQNKINKIIDDNLDTIISDVISDKVNKPSTPVTPSEPDPTPDEPTTSEDLINIDTENKVVTIDPSSQYNGQTLATFLEAKKSELSLEYEDGQYGMFITNIANFITTPYYAVKEGNKLIEYDYYISFYINDDYAQVGPSSTTISENDVYMFLLDGYSTSNVIAEIAVHQPGDPAYQVNLWGQTQSTHHYNWVLSINKDLEQGKDTKVQDVLKLLKFNITTSATGYQAFEYAGNRISQSAVVDGRRAFVPTVYKVTGASLSYAKGVAEGKSSTEIVTSGSTAQYYLANEWDGSTLPEDATFE